MAKFLTKNPAENFDIEIQESGIYKITVTGKKAKGSVSFKKVADEKETQEEAQQKLSEKTIDLSEAYMIVEMLLLMLNFHSMLDFHNPFHHIPSHRNKRERGSMVCRLF